MFNKKEEEKLNKVYRAIFKTPFMSWRDSDNINMIDRLSEKLHGWDSDELNLLDKKFDALCEYLKVEFVDEKTSDGSEYGDEERFYARKIKKTNNK